jgi:hypothetical protein
MRFGHSRSLRQSGVVRTLGRRNGSIVECEPRPINDVPGRGPYWKTGRDFGLVLGIPFRLLIMRIQTAVGVVEQLFFFIINYLINQLCKCI